MSKVTPLKFKKNVEPGCSSDFWYDLTDGGYIKPEDFLHKNDAERVRAAVNLVKQFRDELKANELIEEY